MVCTKFWIWEEIASSSCLQTASHFIFSFHTIILEELKISSESWCRFTEKNNTFYWFIYIYFYWFIYIYLFLYLFIFFRYTL